jgi:hypothetical protein
LDGNWDVTGGLLRTFKPILVIHLLVFLQVAQARKGFLTELALVGAILELGLVFALLLDEPVNISFIILHFGSAVVRRRKADGCVR